LIFRIYTENQSNTAINLKGIDTMAYCTVCGAQFNGNFCPKCGKASTERYYQNSAEYPNDYGYRADPNYAYRQAPYNNPYYRQNPYAQNYGYSYTNRGPISSKSRLAALLLCIFLGMIGVHHFYAGRVGYGVLYIFTGALFGIGWLVDLILIATGSYKDQYGFVIEDWNA